MLKLGRQWVQLNARLFSSTSASVAHSLSHLSRKSRVCFQARDEASTNVTIVPVLSSDDFALRIITADKSIAIQSLFTIEDDAVPHATKDTIVRIAKTSSFDANVQLCLPPTVALDVAVAKGGVTLKDKIEGDVTVVVGRGDIEVDKVRGEVVRLTTKSGKINVLTLVEGKTVKFDASESVTCKRLMAGEAEVKLGKGEALSSTFGAIYASTCNVMSTNQSGHSKLRIGNVHGYLRVSSEGLKRVEIDSVAGAVDVEDSGESCDVVAHFDSWTKQGTSGILVGGNVRVSLQPAASMDVELHGTQVNVGQDCVFGRSERDQLDDEYVVFSGELCAQKPANDAASGSTGKINVDSAKDDAMRTSFFMKDSISEDGMEVKTPRLFVHSLRGQVTLDQLNWMDNVKRKHLKK